MPANQTTYGPHNPHPLSTRRTELIWEGKYDEYGNRREVDVASCVMPLQRIETVDEPLSRLGGLGLTFPKTAHADDFRNRLIWGDNKLVMASLMEEFAGKIDLIYIDPPFDVGADFTMGVPLGDKDDTIEKDQSTLEMVAYRDMWGKGTDSYLNMMYERLQLMNQLLSPVGSIYIHCDWHVNHYLKLVADEVFGQGYFRNQITWKRSTPRGNTSRRYPEIVDYILFYAKTDNNLWNEQYTDYRDEYIEKYYSYKDEDGRRFQPTSLLGHAGVNPVYEWRGLKKPWRYPAHKLDELDSQGLLYWPQKGDVPRLKRYLDEQKGNPVQSLWDDIPPVNSQAIEDTSYATQKPEKLLERIISASTLENSLVADFFCGSGTTGAVAERLGRRWIMCDLGRFAIHTTRKRMIEVQRKLHEEGKPYRAFDVYNLGRYERQWWQKERLLGADEEHRRVVLGFYKAEPLSNAPSPLLHGRKGAALVHVDSIDGIFTRMELRDVVRAAAAAGAKELHCLAWEFEMDLKLICVELEVATGVKIRLFHIPREIMEKNRTNPPPFFEMATLRAEPVYRTLPGGKRGVDIKLVEFLPSLAEVPSKELEALQERAVKNGFDFIDFWAVDFDYQPGQPFEHHWQAYRTRKNRKLPLVSDHYYDKYDKPGRHLVCVKVVDVFGVDTSITVEVET
ncbi:MAG: site-specific DNA-methyltransferase [Firmicutes bacterium]|nr:site-specific DNA-methyltransferase [Bacillota bacterium]